VEGSQKQKGEQQWFFLFLLLLPVLLVFVVAACALQYFMSTGQKPHSVLLRTCLVLLQALSLNKHYL
jgi:hypothetical protein